MKLFNGDCLEIMKDIPDESVDLVIIDPPYEFGNGYIKDEYVIKKVTKTIEDINNGFKGAYVTLKIDLTDVSVGAILLESCKCCTTILDFWLEKGVSKC